MNFLSLFVLIPILMLGGLFLSRNMKQIRWVAATGASLLLVLSVVLTFLFLGERAAGNDAEMLFMAEMPWFMTEKPSLWASAILSWWWPTRCSKQRSSTTSSCF